jgi:hypothetical protein
LEVGIVQAVLIWNFLEVAIQSVQRLDNAGAACVKALTNRMYSGIKRCTSGWSGGSWRHYLNAAVSAVHAWVLASTSSGENCTAHCCK